MGLVSSCRQRRSFNSRTREGCDIADEVASMTSPVFQFTHPGGVRRTTRTFGEQEVRFQFTHPGGVRPGSTSEYPYIATFQFTHPGGVRRELLISLRNSGDVSIHAPGRGATEAELFTASMPLFQFTHPGGVRLARNLI